jgi:hypothetical protein
MVGAPQIFRVRILLEATAPVRLHAHQAGILYGLLARAAGRSNALTPAVPDGLMLDAPE